MKNKRGLGLVEGIAILVILVLIASIVIPLMLRMAKRAFPPIKENIQEGYAIPGKLLPNITDWDNNHKYELTLSYDGINYLVVLDDKGKPQLREYKIESAKIVLE